MTDYLLQLQEAGRAPAPQQVLQRSASALESFNERVGAALRGLFGRKGAVDEMVDEERRLGFSHSHNDAFNWDAFHAWQDEA